MINSRTVANCGQGLTSSSHCSVNLQTLLQHFGKLEHLFGSFLI